MTSREIVKRTLYFQTPERLAHDFPEPYGRDFYDTGLDPSPDRRMKKGVDAWGCVWDCANDNTILGEVKDSPLKDWDDFSKLTVPSIDNEEIWYHVKAARENAGDLYIYGGVVSLYERVHFVRGFQNTWSDVLENPDNLKMFINMLADMNVRIIERYAMHGVDGIFFCDDWGLQDRLMINPKAWREIWKPGYKRVFDAAHNAGLDVWMHSCGYIMDILGDLIEVGLNAINMDQQENMGLERLGEMFRGKVTFFNPVDIQQTMAHGNPEEIVAYSRRMAELLGTKAGGFIPRWYADPVGAGHKRENVNLMCETFLQISKEMYGA